jgi:hypothetical protein
VGVRVQARYLCLLLQCPSALRINGERRFGLLCVPWITPTAGEPAPICVGMFEPGAGIVVDVATGNTVPRPITPVVLPMDAVPAPAAAKRVDGRGGAKLDRGNAGADPAKANPRTNDRLAFGGDAPGKGVDLARRRVFRSAPRLVIHEPLCMDRLPFASEGVLSEVADMYPAC